MALHPDSAHRSSCSTVVFFWEKKNPRISGPQTVQTPIVQGSALFHFGYFLWLCYKLNIKHCEFYHFECENYSCESVRFYSGMQVSS